MSDTRDYSTLRAARPSAARRTGVIAAAFAVIVMAGLSGCTDSGSEASSGSTPSPGSSNAAPATSAKASAVPTVAFPPAAENTIGGRYWAVYLALPRKADDPKATAAERSVFAAGYQQDDIVYGPIDCDDGARQALARAGIRLDPNVDYGTVKLFFASQQHAKQFVDAYRPGVIGTAFVTWSCAD